jgi:ribonuclease HI
MFPGKTRRLNILEEMERLATLDHNTPQTTTSQRFLNSFDGFFEARQQPLPPRIEVPPAPIPIAYEAIQATQQQQPNQFHIFTDGSCLNNGKKGAKASYAVVILGISETGPPIQEIGNTIHVSEPQTNQRAELMAIKVAVDICNKDNLWKKADKVIFWTDSQYALKCITEWGLGWRAKGWKKRDGKPVEHLDILRPLIELKAEKGPNFSLRYVEAHQSAAKSREFPWCWNARADTLAQACHC